VGPNLEQTGKARARSKSGEFNKARAAFGHAIHNGSKILQLDLNRYILCSDLISPINNVYKINRIRTTKKNVSPGGTADMLIVAMGIWLKQQYVEKISRLSRRRPTSQRCRTSKIHKSRGTDASTCH
jgi:hypothetical protein